MAGTDGSPRPRTVLQLWGFRSLTEWLPERISPVTEPRYRVVTLAVMQAVPESAEHGRVVDFVERSEYSRLSVSADLAVVIGGEDRPGLHCTPVQATPPHLQDQQSGLTNVPTVNDFA